MEFKGYIRENGTVGIRNHLLVISSVVCANTVTQAIGAQVPGAKIITHQHGCTQMGIDKETTLKALAGMGKNPNVGAVLVVGLGCETISTDLIAAEISKTGKTVETVVIQEAGGTLSATSKGVGISQQLLAALSKEERQPASISRITLATECGGSDAYSGLTANPALGVAADKLVELGARVILSETTEFIGAEQVLAKRAADEQIAVDIFRIVKAKEQEALNLKVDLRGANPTPGNIAGGLSTIEEKSLGCIYKGGSSIINEVVAYAVEPTKGGLVIMDTPGNDAESITGMVAGGAQIVVFTTGRGTPLGCPVAPVIKVATNTKTFNNMLENMDINAGNIITGTETINTVGEEILREIIEVANGKLTKAEILNHCEFSLSRIAPTF
ncbi:MAG: UxaA family hydrolase [Bacillota bacterium]|nr:UxaA family hydrolase [Bacillota bacterium]